MRSLRMCVVGAVLHLLADAGAAAAAVAADHQDLACRGPVAVHNRHTWHSIFPPSPLVCTPACCKSPFRGAAGRPATPASHQHFTYQANQYIHSECSFACASKMAKEAVLVQGSGWCGLRVCALRMSLLQGPQTTPSVTYHALNSH